MYYAMKEYPADHNDLLWQVIENIQNDKSQREHSLRTFRKRFFVLLQAK